MQENILLTKKEYSLDIRPLLKLIMSKIFGSTCCLVDSLTEFIKPCKETMKLNLSNNLLASKNIVEKFSESNKDAPLLAHICKLYHSETALSFYALTKVYSGTIKEGQKIKLLGKVSKEGREESEELEETVRGIYIYQAGRYKVRVEQALPGNLVVLEGIDRRIRKEATIVDPNFNQEAKFREVSFINQAVVKLALEPLVPSDLPKMVEGLQKVLKSYPILNLKVEESGEHVLIGTGELMLDAVMLDLRQVYSKVEIKTSEPFSAFAETVADTSSVNCFA